jgi:hypothetical protein
MAGAILIVVDVFWPVDQLLWTVGVCLALGAGLSMFAADATFRRLDARHAFLEPGLRHTEYEFVQAAPDKGGSGKTEGRADEAPLEGGPPRAQRLAPLLIKVETASRACAGKPRDTQKEQPKADQHALTETARDACHGNGRSCRSGERVPGLERLSRPDPRHSTTPVADTAAPIQPPRVRNVER